MTKDSRAVLDLAKLLLGIIRHEARNGESSEPSISANAWTGKLIARGLNIHNPKLPLGRRIFPKTLVYTRTLSFQPSSPGLAVSFMATYIRALSQVSGYQ